MKLRLLLLCATIVTASVAWRHDRRRYNEKRPHRSRNRFHLSHLLDQARPFLEGEFRLGPYFNLNWDLLGVENIEKWWEGPNVCHTQEETVEDAVRDIQYHHMMSAMSCDQTDTYYKCVQSYVLNGKKKTITNTFECCYGYEREPRQSGCMKELNLKGLIETLDDLELTDVVRGLESVALFPLINDGNFTIFAPINGSFDFPDTEALEYEAIRSNVITLYPHTVDIVDDVRDMLSCHLVEGFHKSGQLDDEMVLQTFSSRGGTIRINKYEAPKQLTTANCVPVQSTDHLATNGIVHVVTGLLPPATSTLYELILSDTRFTTLTSLLRKTELDSVISGLEGSFTLFAPTNAAFDKLGPQRLGRLRNNTQCLQKMLKGHMLPNVICSSVIQGRPRTKNLLDEYVYVMRNDTNDLYVEQARIVERDVMGANGVIHVIDDVILPDSALDIVEMLAKEGLSEFVQLLDVAGLKNEFATVNNVTILVPSQQAIESIPGNKYQELEENLDELKTVLKYHVIRDGELKSSNIRDGMQFNTMVDDSMIAIRQYSSLPFRRNNVVTAQCARITGTVNIQSCNAIAHVIDKVLMPPVGDIMAVLSQNAEFSVFTALLEESGVAVELQGAQTFTVFAPTNRHLQSLDLSDLRSKPLELRALLRNHILSDILCCDGIFSSRFGKSLKERMLGGNYVTMSRRGDEVRVDDNIITSCDVMATNGVVHTLAGVLDDEENPWEFHFSNSWVNLNLGGQFEKPFEAPDLQESERSAEKGDDNEWPWWMRRLSNSRRN